jgi:hypothetical protein
MMLPAQLLGGHGPLVSTALDGGPLNGSVVLVVWPSEGVRLGVRPPEEGGTDRV